MGKVTRARPALVVDCSGSSARCPTRMTLFTLRICIEVMDLRKNRVSGWEASRCNLTTRGRQDAPLHRFTCDSVEVRRDDVDALLAPPREPSLLERGEGG